MCFVPTRWAGAFPFKALGNSSVLCSLSSLLHFLGSSGLTLWCSSLGEFNHSISLTSLRVLSGFRAGASEVGIVGKMLRWYWSQDSQWRFDYMALAVQIKSLKQLKKSWIKLVFAGSLLWTEKIHRTELNQTVVRSIFGCSCPNLGLFWLPVASFQKSFKTVQRPVEIGCNWLNGHVHYRAL